ncbi:hypothetical protein E2562_021908 [Oryza meyeriana var. granulata]|uniref:Uncharacterized protein n=1 Tax=Oryza meyeriana var. granulata TaxID=110450 RepID=A0A6G1C8R2_9ORYZ|nr:hypothetical protein E2562_021908 [Oryza meyeriana var. granulata]
MHACPPLLAASHPPHPHSLGRVDVAVLPCKQWRTQEFMVGTYVVSSHACERPSVTSGVSEPLPLSPHAPGRIDYTAHAVAVLGLVDIAVLLREPPDLSSHSGPLPSPPPTCTFATHIGANPETVHVGSNPEAERHHGNVFVNGTDAGAQDGGGDYSNDDTAEESDDDGIFSSLMAQFCEAIGYVNIAADYLA